MELLLNYSAKTLFLITSELCFFSRSGHRHRRPPRRQSSPLSVLPKFLQVEAFTKLSTAISRVIEAQVDMPIVGAISLHISLLTFTLGVHPYRLDYVDQVLDQGINANQRE
ncbi:vacuolar protein sorting-associated protein 35B [Trifolium repens]|nr:vacuolar protein sorting-associated protein 35B [Trifolium repens]